VSSRLQIIVPSSLDRRVRKAAQRSRLSVSAYVREAIERSLADERTGGDALDRLAALEAPTGDIGQLISEIEAGRG